MAAPAVAVLEGLALGVSLAAPPGPVNALIAREAARGGLRAGVRAGLPAPILDSAYLLLFVVGLPRLVDLRPAAPWLAAAGALFMAILAWQVIRVRDEGPPRLASAWAIWGVTLSNPFQYGWWLGAGTSLLTGQGVWGVAGFLAAIFGWVVAFSALVTLGAQRWPWFTPTLELASADALALYAAQLALVAAQGL